MTKAEAFLARIGLSGTPIAHTVDFLGAVQTACVLTIPYENLDILADKPVSLDGEDIYRKIVTEHRGGYCFVTSFAASVCIMTVVMECPAVS